MASPPNPSSETEPEADRDHGGSSSAAEPDVSWPPWVLLSSGQMPHVFTPPTPRRLLLQLLLATLAVVAVATLTGIAASGSFARSDAIRDGRQTADLLATAVVEPAVEDGVSRSQPAALRRLDKAVTTGVLPHGVVRVKLWNRQGRILYSDEPRLIGTSHALDADKLKVLTTGDTYATISPGDDADNDPEHLMERGTAADLLEVYRPIRTPDGTVLLLEMYGDYAAVEHRENALLRVMLIVIGATMTVVLLLLAPLLWGMIRSLQAAAGQRERLLRAAITAADDERRRIAGTLHDGPVQELAGSALILQQASDRAKRAGQPEVAQPTSFAASIVRTNIASLRSLMVDIYPPQLSGRNLIPVLDDLAQALRARGTAVDVQAADSLGPVDDARALLTYRVVRECLRNVAEHAEATKVTIKLASASGGALRVDVVDNGVGFDATTAVSRPRAGHLGFSVLTDLANEAHASLTLRSTPSLGTWWRLSAPARDQREVA